MSCSYLTKQDIREMPKDSALSTIVAACKEELKRASPPPILFYFTALFSQKPKRWSQCAKQFRMLKNSLRLTSFLTEEIFGVSLGGKTLEECIEKAPKLHNTHESKTAFALLSYLLRLEHRFHSILRADPVFFKTLFDKLDQGQKQRLLSLRPVSPILVFLATSKEHTPEAPVIIRDDFYLFTCLAHASADGRDRASLIERGVGLGCKEIRDIILHSQFEVIRNLGGVFDRVFPEYSTEHRTISKSRFSCFSNVYSFPLANRVLQTYLSAVCREKALEGDSAINLYLFYVKKVLSIQDIKLRQSLMRNVLEEWFFEVQGLSDVFLRDISCIKDIDEFTKNVYACSYWLPDLLLFGKSTRKSAYFEMILCIATKWPMRKHIELVEENMLYFEEQTFSDKLKKLIRALKEFPRVRK